MSAGAAGFGEHDAGTRDLGAAPLVGYRWFRVDAPDKPLLTRRTLGSGGALISELPPSAKIEPSTWLGRPGLLRAMHFSDYCFQPGVNEAACLSAAPCSVGRSQVHGPVPSRTCGCGFWAYADLPAEGAHAWTSGKNMSSYLAIGVVEAWGRAIVGPLGFRASHVKVRAVAFPRWQQTVERLPASMFERLTTAMTGQMPVVERRPPLAWENVPPRLQQQLAAIYPEVQVFGRIEAMLAAFPPTPLAGLLPQPESESA